MRKSIIISVILFGGLACFRSSDAVEPVYIYAYTDPNCPSCESMSQALETLHGRYPNVRIVESDVSASLTQETILYDMLSAYQASSDALPAVFIGHSVFVGYDEVTVQNIEREIIACTQDGCPSPNQILQEYYQSLQTETARQDRFPEQLFWALVVILLPIAGLVAIIKVWRHFRKAQLLR